MTASLPAEAWAQLLRAGHIRHHEAGDVLLRQGDPGTHVLMLVSGRVKILRRSPDGDVLMLAVRGPGEILGEISVLDGEGSAPATRSPSTTGANGGRARRGTMRP